MSYARKKDGSGWRAVKSAADCAADETWQEQQPAPITDSVWALYQAQAQALLDESDVTVLRCIEHGVTVPAEWATYRADLRAIVSASTGDATKPLPTRPAYPSGT